MVTIFFTVFNQNIEFNEYKYLSKLRDATIQVWKLLPQYLLLLNRFYKEFLKS